MLIIFLVQAKAMCFVKRAIPKGYCSRLECHAKQIVLFCSDTNLSSLRRHRFKGVGNLQQLGMGLVSFTGALNVSFEEGEKLR